MKARPLTTPVAPRRHPLALACGTLVLAALALAAQRAHGQTQTIENRLVPTQNPCTSCAPDALAPAAPQTLPATPAPAAAAFRLEDVRLTGAKALPPETLRALVQPYIGRDVTLPDLEALAQQIGATYRARGFFLAQAVVPVQTVQNGVVEISVIEGRLGKVLVSVAPDAPITEERVRAFLAGLVPDQALDTTRYERAMLLLSDQPGIRASSSLQEGVQPGTTDLTVEVVAGSRWDFTLDADNHGTEETGRYRIGGTVRWSSPLGIGDNLDARLMASNENGMAFGRVSYEAPLGASGLRAGLGLAHTNYELGGDFAALDAHGSANVVDASLSYPLIRSRRQNLFLRLGADQQDLTDHYDALAYDAKKRVRGLGFGWAWELRDDFLGGGYWASSGSYYHGNLDIRTPLGVELDADPERGGLGTEGDFDKLTFRVSRLQSILPRHSLYVSLGGQWAGKNLDASQRLSLGGAYAVRAYPQGELLVDEGLIGTIEWRWSFNEEITPYVFYDAATGHVAKDPLAVLAGVNSQSLRGAGLGVSWARPGNFSITATLAWRAGTREAITDGGGHDPRFFVQLQKAF